MLSYWVQETALQKELVVVEDKHLVIARNLSRTFERYARDTKAAFKHVGEPIVRQNLHESEMLLNTMGITGVCRVKKSVQSIYSQ
jgi:hypothetical protein